MTTRATVRSPGPIAGSRALIAGVLILLAAILVRTAWIADDAFFTFRTAENLLAGEGPRWNTGERVQVFTHPLWLAVLTIARALTGELYFTALALSAGFSLVAAGLMLRRAEWAIGAALAATILISSKAFVEYATSGLEHGLSYLLLALAGPVVLSARPSIRDRNRLFLLASLSTLTHPIATLLIVPGLVRVFRITGRHELLRPALIALAPLGAWLVFAFIYYGSVVPNPWLAWLGSARSMGELAAQGFVYLIDSLVNDPVTLFAVAIALTLARLVRQPGRGVFATGMLLALLATILAGGDGQTGRLLAAPLFFAATFISRQRLIAPAWAAPVPLAVVIALGQFGASYPLWSGSTFGPRPNEQALTLGISDARRLIYAQTGLLRWTNHSALLEPIAQQAAEVRARGDRVIVPDHNTGRFAYYIGRDGHVIDVSGRADPLLALLPVERPWRADAIRRAVPPGYLESIKAESNTIGDPIVAAAYADVRLRTTGPLLGDSWGARWRLVADMWRLLWTGRPTP